MLRHVITASIALTVGVLVGIGIAELNRGQRIAALETTNDDLTFNLGDAQAQLKGAIFWRDYYENLSLERQKEIVSARQRLAKLDPPSAPEIEEATWPLAQLTAGDNSDPEWQRLKKKNLDAPPKIWVSQTVDAADRIKDFHAWSEKTEFLSPDASSAVLTWLEQSDTKALALVVTNKPTGAQYRVDGEKRADGVNCSIKFVGNINW